MLEGWLSIIRTENIGDLLGITEMGGITNCQSLYRMFKRIHMVIAICMVKDVGYRIIIEATYSNILRD